MKQWLDVIIMLVLGRADVGSSNCGTALFFQFYKKLFVRLQNPGIQRGPLLFFTY